MSAALKNQENKTETHQNAKIKIKGQNCRLSLHSSLKCLFSSVRKFITSLLRKETNNTPSVLDFSFYRRQYLLEVFPTDLFIYACIICEHADKNLNLIATRPSLRCTFFVLVVGRRSRRVTAPIFPPKC